MSNREEDGNYDEEDDMLVLCPDCSSNDICDADTPGMDLSQCCNCGRVFDALEGL